MSQVAITRWWWVRHAPVTEDGGRVYGQSDPPANVSDVETFRALAAMLPRAWDKRLVDLNVGPLSDADLAWADYAFVGGMVVQRESARAIISGFCEVAGSTSTEKVW